MPEITTEKLNQIVANEKSNNQIELQRDETIRKLEERIGRDFEELEKALSLAKGELIKLAEVDIEERRADWKKAVELRNERRLQNKQEQNNQQDHERE